MHYYEDAEPFEDPYEEALGAVLNHLQRREHAAEQQRQEQAQERRDQELAALAKRYPQLRDEEFVTEVAKRSRALADRAGDPELFQNPVVVEEMTKIIEAERAVPREVDWWASVKTAGDTNAFGDSPADAESREKQKQAEVERIEKARREGTFELTPEPEPEDREKWFEQTAGPLGDPFQNANPNPVADSNRELAAELRALRTADEPEQVPEPSES